MYLYYIHVFTNNTSSTTRRGGGTGLCYYFLPIYPRFSIDKVFSSQNFTLATAAITKPSLILVFAYNRLL